MLEKFKLDYLKLYVDDEYKKFSFTFEANNYKYHLTKEIFRYDGSIAYTISCDDGVLLAWDDTGFTTVDLMGDDYIILKEVMLKEFGITIPDFF
jgi:hypothetical protein